jgi:hypothetical protein
VKTLKLEGSIDGSLSNCRWDDLAIGVDWPDVGQAPPVSFKLQPAAPSATLRRSD